MFALTIILGVLLLLNACRCDDVITYNDRDVISRIPTELKDAIDSAVSRELDRIISLHFTDNNWAQFNADATHITRNAQLERDEVVLKRKRRDTDDVYSQWSEYDACTVKCGGGYQVRTRTCISGSCESTVILESRECGFLPCVAGTYVLDSLAISSRVPVEKAINFQFFTIGQEVYFGFINSTLMTILSINPFTRQYVLHQTIPCVNAVAFDILNTHRRYFLIILEEAPNPFGRKSSSLYYFDMFQKTFRSNEPVRFDVRNPAAVKSFDVFGVPFIAIVTKFDRRQFGGSISQGGFERVLVCDRQAKTISCQGNSLISITRVFYGRTDAWECGGGLGSFGYYRCEIPPAKGVVEQTCNDKKSCRLEALETVLSQGYFSYNCFGFSKYLNVEYTCLDLTYMSTPKFYKWDGIGLAFVSGDNLFTYGAKDIEAFAIHNQQYLAVANFENDQGQHHLDSEIYVYDVLLGRFSSLQKLRTDGAVDFEFFIVGKGLSKEYFLAVANNVKVLPTGDKIYEVESIIYKWNWNVFVPFQCIKTNGARKWVAVTGENGEFLLSVINDYNVTYFYGYDGWRFYLTKVQPNDGIFTRPQNMIAFLDQGQPKLLVYNEVNNTVGQQNVFQLNFMKTFPKYELFEETIQRVQELNRTFYETVTPSVSTFNETFNEKKDGIVFLDQDFNLTATKTFRTVEVEGDTILDHAEVDQFDLSPDDKNYKNIQNNLQDSLISNNQSILAVDDFLSRAVTRNTEQIISGTNTFTNTTNVQKLSVHGDVDLSGLLNSFNISDIRSNAVLIDENSNITGSIQFDDHVTFSGNLDVDGTVNSVDMSDVIQTDTNDVISGEKTFVSLQAEKDISLQGLLSDKNTSHVFRSDISQEVSGKYSFQKELTLHGNLSTQKNVNGLDLESIQNDAVFINVPNQNITSRLQFDGISLKSDLNMADYALINGVDVSSLVASRPHLNAQREINGSVIFADKLSFKGPLTIKGTLNGVLASDVTFLKQDALIQGERVINGHVTAHKETTVHGKLNGVAIDDIMDTFSDQVINSRKTFKSESLYFDKDLDVSESIDDVDVSKKYSSTMLHGVNQTVTGHKTVSRLSSETMVLGDCVQGCSLLDILMKLQSNTVKKSNKTTQVNGKKTFIKGLNILGNLVVHGLTNGEKVPGRFMLQNKDQIIERMTTFHNITALGNINVSSINGINITELYHRLVFKDQSIVFEEDVTFTDSVNFKNPVTVQGNVDGVKVPDDVILTNANYTLENEIQFTNVVNVQNLSVVNMTVYGFIDGVNLTYLNSELVSHKNDQIVKGTKTFASHVSFAGDWDIPGLIDGVNITELSKYAMRLNEDQQVTARKTFRSNVDVTGQVNVSGLVDNVNLTDINLKAIRKDKPNQVMTKNVYFENVVIKGNLTTSGLVNGVEMKSKFDDALLKSGNQEVSGNYEVKNLNVAEELHVNGLVNNKNLSEEILLVNGEGHTIQGTKHFLGGMETENLTVQLINGINVTDILERTLYIDRDAVINAPIEFKNKTSFQNLTLSHFINGLNFSELINTAFLKNADQNITVPTNFNNVIVQSEATVLGLLNSINFNQLEKDLIYKCSGHNRDFLSDVVFKNASIMKELTAEEISVRGFVNGINVTKLENDVVTMHGDHTIAGVKTFVGNTQIGNVEKLDTLNGLRFPEDLVLLTGNATISGVKEFLDSVTISSDLKIAPLKQINSMDVSEFVKNIVLKSSNDSQIHTAVHFEKQVILHGNTLAGLVNGLQISDKHLLLRNRQQNITGRKIINSISAFQDITTKKLINGIDLRRIQNQSILLDEENKIKGAIKILGDVIIKGNLWTNLLDESNVTVKFGELTQVSHFVEHDTVSYDTFYTTNKNILLQITNVVGDIYQCVDYFSLWQEILLPYSSISFDVIVKGGSSFLVAGAYQGFNGAECYISKVYSASAGGNFSITSQVFGTSSRHTKLINHDNHVMMMSSSAIRSSCFLEQDVNKEYINLFRSNDPADISFPYTTSMVSSGASHIDIYDDFSAGTLGIVTNKKDPITGSDCTNQTLFSLVNGQPNILLDIFECSVVKSIIVSANQTHVLVAILVSTTEHNEVILVNIPRDFTSPVVRTTITTHFAQDIMTYSDESGKYLVIVNTYDTSSEALVVSYTTPIEIYRVDSDGTYTIYQSVDTTAATFARYFTVGVYKYLAVATMEQKVVIYKHRGASKWQEDLTIPVKSLSTLNDMKFWTDDKANLFAAFLTPNMFDSHFPSLLRIVKAEMTTTADGKNVVDSVKNIIV